MMLVMMMVTRTIKVMVMVIMMMTMTMMALMMLVMVMMLVATLTITMTIIQLMTTDDDGGRSGSYYGDVNNEDGDDDDDDVTGFPAALTCQYSHKLALFLRPRACRPGTSLPHQHQLRLQKGFHGDETQQRPAGRSHWRNLSSSWPLLAGMFLDSYSQRQTELNSTYLVVFLSNVSRSMDH